MLLICNYGIFLVVLITLITSTIAWLIFTFIFSFQDLKASVSVCFPFERNTGMELLQPQSDHTSFPLWGNRVVPTFLPSANKVRIAHLFSVLVGPLPLAYLKSTRYTPSV